MPFHKETIWRDDPVLLCVTTHDRAKPAVISLLTAAVKPCHARIGAVLLGIAETIYCKLPGAISSQLSASQLLHCIAPSNCECSACSSMLCKPLLQLAAVQCALQYSAVQHVP
jgi:hypothetical protein